MSPNKSYLMAANEHGRTTSAAMIEPVSGAAARIWAKVKYGTKRWKCLTWLPVSTLLMLLSMPPWHALKE